MFDDLKSVMFRVLRLGSLLVLAVVTLGSAIGHLVAGFPGVFGALSGIPPEDIKYFVEITKGRGGMYKGKNKVDHDTSKEYISPLKK